MPILPMHFHGTTHSIRLHANKSVGNTSPQQKIALLMLKISASQAKHLDSGAEGVSVRRVVRKCFFLQDNFMSIAIL